MVSRATWSGSITFGMVNVPTKVYLAADEKAVTFNQLHRDCGARVRYLKRCEAGHDIASPAEIAKGYPVTKDQYVEMTDDDFAAMPLASKHAVQIVRFIPQGSVDGRQFIKSYFVAPEEVGERGYALLVKAMTDQKVWGLAKLAFRETREHPALVRPQDGRLMLHTLFWPDEMREWPVEVPNITLSKDEVAMAKLLVENLSAPYDPALLTDDYREALLKRIEGKLAGKEPEVVAVKQTGVADLMEALKASVAAEKKPAKAPTRKPAARKKAAS